MYDKIASTMRRDFPGSEDISAEDVEAYLRYGDTGMISAAEAEEIERRLERYL